MDASLSRLCDYLFAGGFSAGVVLALPVHVEAQAIVQVTRQPDHAAHASLPETLRDVLAHLPEHDAAGARDRNSPEDFVTWCHEASHFMNSRLSTTKARGFYTLYSEGWQVPLTKKTTLAQVAVAIPERLRGRTYKTYLIDSRRDWDEFPLYLMDEWLAYQHGSMCRHEMGWTKRRETEEFMAELAIYSVYMVEVVARNEPEYPIEELREFRDFLLSRSRQIASDFDSLPLVKQCGLLEEMK
jgi:hypothetical protein